MASRSDRNRQARKTKPDKSKPDKSKSYKTGPDKTGPGTKRLSINSYADLLKHEQEILYRIEALPNGGNLFLIHPFLLFEEIGVVLAPRAKDEILEFEPRLAALSEVPYRALKASDAPQRFQVRLKGLFSRRSA